MVASAAIGCGDSRERAERRPVRDFAVGPLADAIGTADAEGAIEIVAEAREREVPVRRVLAATWIAPLRWGGLPGDVHALLVLPALDRLLHADAAGTRVDPWMPVCWAVVNATAWCRNPRRDPSVVAGQASDAPLVATIRSGDEDAAAAHAAGLASSAGIARAVQVIGREALEPRSDVHAAIYASQAARF